MIPRASASIESGAQPSALLLTVQTNGRPAARALRASSEELKTVAGFTQEIVADEAVDFLRSKAARTAPFLLWVGFTAPH